VEDVFSESARVFGFASDSPLAWRVDRHLYGRPVVAPGHARRVGDLKSRGSGVRNLALAGDWTASPTVEGAVTSGFLAAASVVSGARSRPQGKG